MQDSSVSNISLLPIFYLPPISWFSVFLKKETEIMLEKKENFPKQTYRNRAEIYGANGKLTLSIPIKNQGKTPMEKVEMSFAEDWKSQHWKSIQSAYQNSPYFEYYQNDLKKIYENEISNLVEFNIHALKIVLKLLKKNQSFTLNSEYQHEFDGQDFRTLFSSKKESIWEMDSYYQVFSDKGGFVKDLSILDLLCNKGPETTTYLLELSKLL